MTWRDRIRAAVERLLPWFDPDLEAERNAHTEDIRRHSIAVRIHTEHVRKAYGLAADKVKR